MFERALRFLAARALELPEALLHRPHRRAWGANLAVTEGAALSGAVRGLKALLNNLML